VSEIYASGYNEGCVLDIRLYRLFRKELVSILGAKWDRIIPCHGEVIQSGGRAAWDKLWGKYT